MLYFFFIKNNKILNFFKKLNLKIKKNIKIYKK
jgi:hypothetical protein